MFSFADLTPDGVLKLNEDRWHHVYKRDAIDDEEEKEFVIDRIKNTPMKIKTELNKDVKILADKTHFRIPSWKELVSVGKDWFSNGKKQFLCKTIIHTTTLT